jgi:tetratricopeptide (TPR) repeat protein
MTRRWSTLLGLVALQIASAATQAQQQQELACDPHIAELRQAKKLIDDKKTSDGERLIEGVLQKDQNNLFAHFLEGNLELLQADTSRQNEGFDHLVTAASLIEQKPDDCAKLLHWRSIYITLGAQYMRKGDHPNARKYLELADAHHEELADSSNQILFEDLGRLNFTEGNFTDAVKYYERAQQLGSPRAQGAIDVVKKLQN